MSTRETVNKELPTARSPGTKNDGVGEGGQKCGLLKTLLKEAQVDPYKREGCEKAVKVIIPQ